MIFLLKKIEEEDIDYYRKSNLVKNHKEQLSIGSPGPVDITQTLHLKLTEHHGERQEEYKIKMA